MLGDLYSAAFNSANFNWLCSPAATELETIVLDWLCKLVNLPECYLSTSPTGGGGVIHGSASEAIITCMVAARERYLRRFTIGIDDEDERERIMDEKRSKLIVLYSDQTHSSTQKGCLIAGVKHRAMKVPRSAKTGNYDLTGDTLRMNLEALIAEGFEPFYTTVNLGTTSTCAVDEFWSIAEVLKDYPLLWVHVDAAYAGSALVLPEFQHLLDGVQSFDSFTINMHKWMMTNFDCSCLFVKERRHLFNALSVTPAYLRNDLSEKGLVTDYRDWQIPLGRRFRALKIWFVMRTYGAKGLQAHIKLSLTCGVVFHNLIKSRPDLFTLFTPPAFALTIFTVNPLRSPKPTENAKLLQNAITKQVYEEINADGKIYLTSTFVDGTYAIRLVSGNPKIEPKYMIAAFEVFVNKVEEFKARLGAGAIHLAN
jgi:aromatic-L-amino-acid decarboxylase